VVASCRNKYYGTNFISAVPTSLLIAPGLWTIQFLFILPGVFYQVSRNFWNDLITFYNLLTTFWQLFDNFFTFFWHFFDNVLTTFANFLPTIGQLFWQFLHFLTAFWDFLRTCWQFFVNFLTVFWQFFLILMVLASCGNKYYKTNFTYAVPTFLLIARGLRTIQFLFI
jgi:hypothetical protein